MERGGQETNPWLKNACFLRLGTYQCVICESGGLKGKATKKKTEEERMNPQMHKGMKENE